MSTSEHVVFQAYHLKDGVPMRIGTVSPREMIDDSILVFACIPSRRLGEHRRSQNGHNKAAIFGSTPSLATTF
jgi:hypothetical protein